MHPRVYRGIRGNYALAGDKPQTPESGHVGPRLLRETQARHATLDCVNRRYHVTTFGCQMNAHDSERIKGMLEELGLGEAQSQGDADVVVFNTCTIREKPDTKFAAYMGEAAARKRERPEMIIAVGG